jgi:hypothetical protein
MWEDGMKLTLAMIACVALAAVSGCAQAPETSKAEAMPAPPAPAAVASAPAIKSVSITEASFGCIRRLEPVRGFYVGNLMGDLDGTLKAARSEAGAVYPVGSVVQLVPTEAMVKREAGYNPATKDWEFFELAVSPTATKINVRGATEVVNRFGGNCLTCHAQAQPQWDMVCEQTHGCAPIPVTPVMAKAIQNTDPRCEKIDLPPEQAEALRQLAAALAARPAAN